MLSALPADAIYLGQTAHFLSTHIESPAIYACDHFKVRLIIAAALIAHIGKAFNARHFIMSRAVITGIPGLDDYRRVAFTGLRGEVLEGSKTFSQSLSEHEIHVCLVRAWKRQLLENGSAYLPRTVRASHGSRKQSFTNRWRQPAPCGSGGSRWNLSG